MEFFDPYFFNYLIDFIDNETIKSFLMTNKKINNIVEKNINYKVYCCIIRKKVFYKINFVRKCIKCDHSVLLNRLKNNNGNMERNKKYLSFEFNRCCQLGILNVAKFIYSIPICKSYIDDNEINMLLKWSCQDNHTNMVKWLLTIVNKFMCLNELFKSACINGNLELLDFFVKEKKLELSMCHISDGINDAIIFGHLNVIKWLLSFGKNIDMVDLFINSCFYDNSDISKLLYLQDTLNNSRILDKAFEVSCKNDCCGTAMWIYMIDRNNVQKKIKDLFEYSCLNGNLRMAQLLYSLENINIYHKKYIFKECCKSGQLNIVRWLYSIEYFDINKYAKRACGWYYDYKKISSKKNVIKRIINYIDNNRLILFLLSLYIFILVGIIFIISITTIFAIKTIRNTIF